MKTLTPQMAKVELKRRGHTYRSAAPFVGRAYQWISHVLNGHEKSRPVLEAIYKLPPRQKPTRRRRNEKAVAA